MAKLIDLTGRYFGRLKVIKRDNDVASGRPMWLCQCRCGKKVTVSSANLLRPNGTKSCGCLRHRHSPALINLKGQQFGKLTVIRQDIGAPPGKSRWICKCECGTTISVLSDSLRSGRAKSCGCTKKQIKYDLMGQRFGYLEVIEPVKNPYIRSNETRWSCLCHNCGRIVEVSSYQLRHGNPYGHCSCTRFNNPEQDESENPIPF